MRGVEPRLPFAPLTMLLGRVHRSVDSVHGDGRYFDRIARHYSTVGDQGVMAELIGVSRRTIVRWAKEGIPESNADAAAVALGAHPCEIWPDWFDLSEVAS